MNPINFLRKDKYLPTVRNMGVAVVMLVACSACATTTGAQSSSASAKTMEGFSPAQQFEIVDCLFPGEVRTVGGRVYMTPRRPGRTTVADCSLRGGEFELYDRANNQASLAVWLPEAESGNAEAQTYVGMLLEKGIDGDGPDYAKAVTWYQRAADSGHAPAKYNLGTLYERGLGVEMDMLKAINLYREAQGVSEDNLVFQSNVRKQLDDQRAKLNIEIDRSNSEIEALRNQIRTLKSDSSASASQISTLESIVARFEEDQRGVRRTLDGLPEIQGPAPGEPPPITLTEAREVGEKRFGRYYALIIGVSDYRPYPSIETVANDVDRAEQVLRDRYGFSVTRLVNPSRYRVMETVNQYFDELGENDNLLVYFSGHGEKLSTDRREYGYWLPTDADAPPNDTNWIANEFITDHLARIKARRILVVSDSIYVDTLESSPGMSVWQDNVSTAYLELKLQRRSRMLLTSGTERPIAAASGRYSRFASAFLDVLESNGALMHVPALFRQIRERLERDARMSDPDPAFRTIKSAQHDLGDFFFLPIKTAIGE